MLENVVYDADGQLLTGSMYWGEDFVISNAALRDPRPTPEVSCSARARSVSADADERQAWAYGRLRNAYVSVKCGAIQQYLADLLVACLS